EQRAEYENEQAQAMRQASSMQQVDKAKQQSAPQGSENMKEEAFDALKQILAKGAVNGKR
ncbi:MAG: hypothetical protein RR107_05755, partial [Clostridia bacterium]